MIKLIEVLIMKLDLSNNYILRQRIRFCRKFQGIRRKEIALYFDISINHLNKLESI